MAGARRASAPAGFPVAGSVRPLFHLSAGARKSRKSIHTVGSTPRFGTTRKKPTRPYTANTIDVHLVVWEVQAALVGVRRSHPAEVNATAGRHDPQADS